MDIDIIDNNNNSERFIFNSEYEDDQNYEIDNFNLFDKNIKNDK